MPQIEGRKEQDDALKRVTLNLKKIEEINSFLKSVSSLSKDPNANISYNVSVSTTNGTDVKKFKSPMHVEDNRFILEAVQAYKSSIADLVRKDSVEHRISLNPKENATLEWKLVMS